ncbi:hypothetical protein TWF506_002961 [Arthrobotrys conoides]|uniref:Uncharacterized protein n=1 Tax=Arthrobotrys conoides TaxID=74498 RepID=A0AAN8NC12_9PEZI
MMYRSTLALLALTASFGVVTPGPVNSNIHVEGHSGLSARGVRKLDKCPDLQGLEVRCFYQEPNALEAGVSASEFYSWLTEKNRNETILQANEQKLEYSISLKPGETRCRQIFCIGESAYVRVCDFRSGLPDADLEYKWTSHDILLGVMVLGYQFWPQIVPALRDESVPEDLEKEAKTRQKWLEQSTDIDSCCSSYYNLNRNQQNTDRVWGEVYLAGETGLRISIEAVRQPINGNPNERVTCDASKNMKYEKKEN